MLNVLGWLAVLCCGLFAGAALHISVVEHPARMRGGVDMALREWAPAYTRATVLQGSLAVLGGATGMLAWALGGGLGYLFGALLLLAVVPFTLLIVSRTDKRLLDLFATDEVENANELLARWNALHAVRTGLSVVAFVAMLVGAGR